MVMMLMMMMKTPFGDSQHELPQCPRAPHDTDPQTDTDCHRPTGNRSLLKAPRQDTASDVTASDVMTW